MEQHYLQLNDIEAFRKAYYFSNKVWNSVIMWDNLSKNTVGMQYIRAVDSISANIAEGFGRFGKKDKIRFYFIAKASALESLDWNQKAKDRNLITDNEYNDFFKELKEFPKLINSLIKFTSEKLKH
jgi:four helix bundle protein